MTDYFALLDQPRRPWLDSEDLKQAFHRKTLGTHPDAHHHDTDATGVEAAFAKINEAYQVLQDPKRRLYHLLTLEGQAPSSANAPVPAEIAALFETVASATQEAERIGQKAAATTNPLSRSLMQLELLRARQGVDGALAALFQLREQAEAELRELDESFAKPPDTRLADLTGLYIRFSYLTRWIEQLEEKRAQLAL